MPPDEKFNWKRSLKRLNELLLEVVADELDEPSYEYLAEQPDPRWLGAPPASARAIASAEERLGLTLPEAYRGFLLASDGWVRADGFPHRMAGLLDTTRIFWMRNDRSREAQQFRDFLGDNDDLLDPPLGPDEDPIDRLLCIGDFDGNECILYVVGTRSDDWPVLVWDPEDGFVRHPGLVELFRKELAYRESEAAG